MCLGLAAFLLYQGAGYLIAGDRALGGSPGWNVLLTVLPGRARTHGAILFALGLGLAVESRAPFDTMMRLELYALRAYSMMVAGCWLGSWWVYGVAWSAPGWWLGLAALTIWLSVYAPRPPTTTESPSRPLPETPRPRPLWRPDVGH